MRGSVSILKLWTDSSTRSTQPRMTVWESDFPLVARSLPAIMGVSGLHRTRVREPRFHSQFLCTQHLIRGSDNRPIPKYYRRSQIEWRMLMPGRYKFTVVVLPGASIKTL